MVRNPENSKSEIQNPDRFKILTGTKFRKLAHIKAARKSLTCQDFEFRDFRRKNKIKKMSFSKTREIIFLNGEGAIIT